MSSKSCKRIFLDIKVLYFCCLIKIFFRSHFSATLLCFNTTSHYHLSSASLYIILLLWCSGVLVFLLSLCTVCVWVHVIVSGVFHYRAPQGRNPPLVFPVDTAVIFRVKNNHQIRGCASRLLRFNCIRVSVPTESRRSKAEKHAERGCVMSDEALRAQGKQPRCVSASG